jgi:protein-disulfide isomerase
MTDRRRVAAGIAALAGALAVGGARAASLPLASDDGSPMRNTILADAEALRRAATAQRFGPADADVVIVEAFDYNCGYCRAAARDLDGLVRADQRLALVPLHLPILSPGSVDAARVEIAVLRRHGAEAARSLHVALLEARGFVDGAKARAIATDLGVSPSEAEIAAADGEVAAQRALAGRHGLRITPSFVIGDVAFVGWPGRPTIERFVASARRCGRIVCA